MNYICIGLIFIILLLTARLYILRRAIRFTADQMNEIEFNPKSNRQLSIFSTDQSLERLLTKINDVYQARQQERIVYQRRETQIRREIENISHDLRTPLTSIIGYVDLIQDPQTEAKERDEYLEIIHKRARVLQGFIHDFYELSRIEGENYPILWDVIQVQNALSEVAVAYYNEFAKSHIRVEINLEEKPSYIIADKIQLNRILNNLVQNALKYAKSKFILKQFTENGECVIQCQNDISFMKEDELKLLFDRFYTGDITRNNESTGLGLTIAKLLVEKMRGSIDAKIENELFVIELRWKIKLLQTE